MAERHHKQSSKVAIGQCEPTFLEHGKGSHPQSSLHWLIQFLEVSGSYWWIFVLALLSLNSASLECWPHLSAIEFPHSSRNRQGTASQMLGLRNGLRLPSLHARMAPLVWLTSPPAEHLCSHICGKSAKLESKKNTVRGSIRWKHLYPPPTKSRWIIFLLASRDWNVRLFSLQHMLDRQTERDIYTDIQRTWVLRARNSKSCRGSMRKSSTQKHQLTGLNDPRAPSFEGIFESLLLEGQLKVLHRVGCFHVWRGHNCVVIVVWQLWFSSQIGFFWFHGQLSPDLSPQVPWSFITDSGDKWIKMKCGSKVWS